MDHPLSIITLHSLNNVKMLKWFLKNLWEHCYTLIVEFGNTITKDTFNIVKNLGETYVTKNFEFTNNGAPIN